MTCPSCYSHARVVANRGYGFDTWRCPDCGTTITDETALCLHAWRCIHCDAEIITETIEVATQPP